MSTESPKKITFYTDRRCPFCRRVHAVLKEIGVKVDEVFVTLDKPREQWYLDINPKGLIPALKYGDEILTESAIIAEFLVDAFPNRILPPPTSPENALFRARARFFVETYNSKVQPLFVKYYYTQADDSRPALNQEVYNTIHKEIEPLLKDANPFFGGKDHLTWVEIMFGSFVIYIKMYATEEAQWIIPQELVEKLKTLPNYWKWVNAVDSHPTINEVVDRKAIINLLLARRAKAAAAQTK
ncbi:thioredoxin-like protein [Kalaharituber pfeilii]|nr:thioredoxin-like protein [Kalaharituber pfeilii]